MDERSNKKKSESNELIKSQFGREAEKYAVSKIHSNQEDLEFARSIINPQTNWVCLDIATGAGHLAHTLAKYSKNIVASDLTKEMLIQAKKIAIDKNIQNMEFEEFDVHNIPHQDNKFHLTTSRIAPHHFHDITKAISEMIRVTKQGGYIFIEDTVSPDSKEGSDLFNHIEILRDPSHIKDLSEKEWVQKFVTQGCEIICVTKRDKEWPLKWWTERMSTPKNNVIQIIKLLEENFDKFNDEIRIINNNSNYNLNLSFEDKLNSWQMNPNNIYLLARKHSSN